MRLTPEDLFEATRKAGARFLLFGGVHKMSTLIQLAQVQIIDVEKKLWWTIVISPFAATATKHGGAPKRSSRKS